MHLKLDRRSCIMHMRHSSTMSATSSSLIASKCVIFGPPALIATCQPHHTHWAVPAGRGLGAWHDLFFSCDVCLRSRVLFLSGKSLPQLPQLPMALLADEMTFGCLCMVSGASMVASAPVQHAIAERRTVSMVGLYWTFRIQQLICSSLQCCAHVSTDRASGVP